MRITKATLRQSKIRLVQSVNDLFRLDGIRLKAYVESSFSGIKIEEANREELLRLAIQWSIEIAIPSSLCD